MFLVEIWTNTSREKKALCPVTDQDTSVSGFGSFITLDHGKITIGKERGWCLHVCQWLNQRWCKNITIREHICALDIELLNVSLCQENFLNFFFCLGDLNQCLLDKTLPSYSQYITCNTCMNKTISLCDGTVRNAYKSVAKAPISDFDHNAVYLIPCYWTVLQCEKCIEINVEVWNKNSKLV